MPIRKIQIIVSGEFKKKVDEKLAKHSFIDSRVEKDTDKRVNYSILAESKKVQVIIDDLQSILNKDKKARITILPVVATIPEPVADEGEDNKKFMGLSREELYQKIAGNAQPNSDFFMLVFLSTIVASIGLLYDNIPVLIGAMVIAPLLGPNLALAFSTTLGDYELAKKSIKSIVFGCILALLVSYLIGFLSSDIYSSHELMLRTHISIDLVFLALASGAAAALSISTGVSSVLVGVMVATALLPPVATSGIFLSKGDFANAINSGLMLAVNIVCINLSAKLMFMYKNITPRTWYQKKKAATARARSTVFWLFTLAALVAVILLKIKVKTL